MEYQIAVGSYTFDAVECGPAHGEVVVLLHGFPQTKESWRHVSKILSNQGFRTIAVDQRGYSPGARPAGRRNYRNVDLAGDIAGIIRSLDASRVHLVGHDWGSQVGWTVASVYPELLASYTGISVPHPVAFMQALTSSKQALRSWYMGAFQAPAIPEALIRAAGGRVDKALAASGMDAESIAIVRDRVIATPALTGGMNYYRAIPFTDRSAIHRISIPTTFIWGDRDTFLDRKGAQLTEKTVTGPYRFQAIAGGGHWLPERNAAEVAELIAERARNS